MVNQASLEAPPVEISKEVIDLLERLFPDRLTALPKTLPLDRALGQQDVVMKLRDLHRRQQKAHVERPIRSLGIEIV